MSRKPVLPVDSVVPQVLASLEHTPNLVIEAAPGTGKTTRIPPALLDVVAGEVWVLEPRRIAARLAARRVAWELDEEVGETVGYQVRFDEVCGPRTRLRFVTEGIFTRRLTADPQLNGIDAVVLDEFHERHIEGDLALALLKRLQQSRSSLRIVVMSATLDGEGVARYLGQCPVLRSEGRLFDVAIEHRPYSPQPLPVQVKQAVDRLLGDQFAGGESGHLLVFLPGIAEIRRTARELEATARRSGLLVLPLHGDLLPAEQDRAVSPCSEQKLILATNVAESSITVDGVTAVIDSGLARIASHSQWTGLPTLEVSRISKASARQRAGRAGRTGPGRVVRLYPEEDFRQRPEHDLPEILRSDLSQLCLNLRAMSIDENLQWLEAPPVDAVRIAESLLDRLGARNGMAKKLAGYPLSPRLARILVEAMERGVGDDGCRAAALLGSGARSKSNDLLAALDLPADQPVRQMTEQLRRIARPPAQTGHNDEALLLAVMTGFPDRAARRRAGRQVLLASGVSAEVSGEPTASEFLLALEAEHRKEGSLPLIRMTARIEPEWLLDLFPEYVEATESVVWNRATERVEKISALVYDKLTLQESRGLAPDGEAADLLARKAMEEGVERFVEPEALGRFTARLIFAGIEPPELSRAVREMSLGLHGFAELREAGKTFVTRLEGQVDTKQLRELAPDTVHLKNGREVPVHYEAGRDPWIASRLQDFFGMKETPRLGQARVPLVIHLLAPNHRAVQTTTDLAGFWERLYPEVRRTLMRRYPRHAWPERP